ncbi:MAG: CbiX/SirB N-terminal domain-containing protein [Opitutaceae bacterium]
MLPDFLRNERFASRDVVVAPLFLSPGRHAGPDGDLAQICRAAPPRTHLTGLVGTHPLVIDALAGALRTTLSTVHAQPFA